MGIIQNAVTQMLGTVGIAARLSPDFERKQAIYSEKQSKKATIAESQQLAKEQPDIEKRIQSAETLGIPARLAEHNRKLAELGAGSPALAASSINQAKMTSDIAKGLKEGKLKIKEANTDSLRQSNAMKKVDSVQVAKAGQKLRAKNYPEDIKRTIAIMTGRDEV